MAYAFRLGCKLKLIGRYQRLPDETCRLIVAPMFVPRDHPIAVADGVFNAILVDGNALGEALFYGQGAGRLPTASAVVADVIECALSTESISRRLYANPTVLLSAMLASLRPRSSGSIGLDRLDPKT